MDTIDITEALFRLNNQRVLVFEQLQTIDFAIANLKGQFTPKFEELDTVKAQNEALSLENTDLKEALDAVVPPVEVTPIEDVPVETPPVDTPPVDSVPVEVPVEATPSDESPT